MPKTVERIPALILSALVCVLCAACASAPTDPANPDAPPPARSPADPWEPLNRGLYIGTRAIDRATLRPISIGYGVVVPGVIRQSISNFSLNLRAPLNIINNFLQGKLGDGFRQTGRFVMNTTFGLGGLIDVATGVGIDVVNEDFGQTLAVWGVPDGPYVYVPFLGPRTLRDATMIPLDFLADPLFHYNNASVRDKVYLVRAISVRHRLLSAEELLKDAYDPYIALREAYLQRRQFLIYDGDPPEDEDLYEDFDDEYEEE
jgi:phospholipid-binding lipoprotein MlaA